MALVDDAHALADVIGVPKGSRSGKGGASKRERAVIVAFEAALGKAAARVIDANDAEFDAVFDDLQAYVERLTPGDARIILDALPTEDELAAGRGPSGEEYGGRFDTFESTKYAARLQLQPFLRPQLADRAASTTTSDADRRAAAHRARDSFGLVGLGGDAGEDAMLIMGGLQPFDRNPGKTPTARGRDGSIVLAAGGPPGKQLTAEEEAVVWGQVATYDEESLVAFCVVLSRLLTAPAGSEVVVSVDEALALTGIAPHSSGGFRPVQKREMRDKILAVLRHLWGPAARASSKDPTRWYQVFEVGIGTRDTTTGGVHILPNGMPDVMPFSFHVSFAKGADFLLGDGARNIMPFVAMLATYDPRIGVEQKAIRLALTLSFRWHSLVEDDRTQQQWTVAELLETARIPVPAHHPNRFKEQVEAALDRLKKDGVIGGWRYVERHWNGRELRRRETANWKLAQVEIEPPEVVRRFYGLDDLKALPPT